MIRNITIFVVSVFMLSCFGCEVSQKVTKAPDGTFQKTCVFVPHKINFNQLTEFSKQWQITAYVDVSDQFNSRMKAAGIWRFELYPKVPRSADPMGGRIHIWQDIDLTQPMENNRLWQDYLRCYKFELNLETELAGGETYILEAICFTADDKRLSDTIELKR